eukprot:TRINITY_DN1151_c0_g2_i1.p1 TRINITY_DN1151_c0_g2~~TRINITY_DN1151_c0_g2_i1.p1  ORF type:complete len:458 (-),score=89.59 TRINITY_DN1151_c0_g2_i1:972-2183(-)
MTGNTTLRKGRLLSNPPLGSPPDTNLLKSSAHTNGHALPTTASGFTSGSSHTPSQALLESQGTLMSIQSLERENNLELSDSSERQGSFKRHALSPVALFESDDLYGLNGHSSGANGLFDHSRMEDDGAAANVAGVQNRAWRDKASAELLREREVSESTAHFLTMDTALSLEATFWDSQGMARQPTVPPLPAFEDRQGASLDGWSGKAQAEKEGKADVRVEALPEEVLDGDALVGQLSRLEIGDLRTGLFLASNRRRLPRPAGLTASQQQQQANQEGQSDAKVQGNFEDEEDVNQPLLRRVATIWQQMGGGESDDDKEELTAMVRAMRQRTIDHEQQILQERAASGSTSGKGSPSKEKLLVLQESHEELMESLKGNFRSSGAARAAAALVYQDWELQRVAQGAK